MECRFSSDIPLINRMSALRRQNRILKGFEHEVGPLVCEIPTMPTDFPGGTLVYPFGF